MARAAPPTSTPIACTVGVDPGPFGVPVIRTDHVPSAVSTVVRATVPPRLAAPPDAISLGAAVPTVLNSSTCTPVVSPSAAFMNAAWSKVAAIHPVSAIRRPSTVSGAAPWAYTGANTVNPLSPVTGPMATAMPPSSASRAAAAVGDGPKPGMFPA